MQGELEDRFWEDEPPLFGQPRYPILLPPLLFWVLVTESVIAWAALWGDYWERWLDVTFGPLPESRQEEETA